MGHILIYDIYGYEKYRGLSPLIEIIQSVEMPLFTMVSGFVASCKRPFLQSIYKNFRQLLVPFFVFSALYIFAFQLDPIDLYGNPYKSSFWYLLSLFYWNLLLYPLVWLANKAKKVGHIVYLSFFLGSIILLYFSRYIPYGVGGFFSVSVTLQYFPYFVVGNYIRRYNLEDKIFACRLAVVLFIVWILTLDNNILRYICGISGSFVLLFLCKNILVNSLKLNKYMNYIGLRTLYIYIFHIFFYTIFFCPWAEFVVGKGSVGWDFFVSIVPTLAFIILSLIAERLISKLKKLNRALFYR